LNGSARSTSIEKHLWFLVEELQRPIAYEMLFILSEPTFNGIGIALKQVETDN
jgi:hypothetical protein